MSREKKVSEWRSINFVSDLEGTLSGLTGARRRKKTSEYLSPWDTPKWSKDPSSIGLLTSPSDVGRTRSRRGTGTSLGPLSGVGRVVNTTAQQMLTVMLFTVSIFFGGLTILIWLYF